MATTVWSPNISKDGATWNVGIAYETTTSANAVTVKVTGFYVKSSGYSSQQSLVIPAKTLSVFGTSVAFSLVRGKTNATITLSPSTYPSKTFAKTHSAQTKSLGVSLSFDVNAQNTFAITGEPTWPVSVPALASYTVSYNANGGSGAPSAQTKWYGENLTLSTTKPTRTGYSFAGWNTNSSGTGTNYSAGGTYTGNAALTLYAKWTANTYTVSYNANGGSGAPSSQTKTYGVNLTLSSTRPTRTGYTFAGWNTNSSGTGTSYSAGGTYSANSAATLYAKWTANTYYVRFNANYPSDSPSTSGSMSRQTFTYGTAQRLTACAFTAQEYAFDGWATSAGGARAYTDQQSVSSLTSTSGGEVNLYARWRCTHTAPTITGLAVQRCDEEGDNDEGTWMRVSCTLNVNDSDYEGGTLVVRYRERGASEWTSDTTVLEEGSTIAFEKVYDGFGIESTYEVALAFTDGFGATASASDILSQAFFTLDLKDGGKGLAIGCPAVDDNFTCGMDAHFLGTLQSEGSIGTSGHVTVAGKVNASGRVTGNDFVANNGGISTTNGGVYEKFSDVSATATSLSANQYKGVLSLNDTSGNTLMYQQVSQATSGNVSFSIGARRKGTDNSTNVTNAFGLTIARDGTCGYSVTDPSKFLNAIRVSRGTASATVAANSTAEVTVSVSPAQANSNYVPFVAVRQNTGYPLSCHIRTVTTSSALVRVTNPSSSAMTIYVHVLFIAT